MPENLWDAYRWLPHSFAQYMSPSQPQTQNGERIQAYRMGSKERRRHLAGESKQCALGSCMKFCTQGPGQLLGQTTESSSLYSFGKFQKIKQE